jgi:hypothetical protein
MPQEDNAKRWSNTAGITLDTSELRFTRNVEAQAVQSSGSGMPPMRPHFTFVLIEPAHEVFSQFI